MLTNVIFVVNSFNKDLTFLSQYSSSNINLKKYEKMLHFLKGQQSR